MKQSWWQMDWHHCKIPCPNGGHHCSVMSLKLAQMFLHTKLYGCWQTSPLVKRPTSDGYGHLVDHERLGVARSGLMSECHLVTTGTAEWRNNPQGLCNDDDDDGSLAANTRGVYIPCSTYRHGSWFRFQVWLDNLYQKQFMLWWKSVQELHKVSGTVVADCVNISSCVDWHSVENENHCDFVRLREMLIRTNMEDLRETTHYKHYELYRRCKLHEMGFSDDEAMRWVGRNVFMAEQNMLNVSQPKLFLYLHHRSGLVSEF